MTDTTKISDNQNMEGNKRYKPSISDIEEKLYSGENTNEDELKALKNYEKYKIKTLKNITDEKKYHQTFIELQVEANVCPYVMFLEEEDENNF
ncbi:MAG: hypothetical protein ABEH43_10725 [Flavobacteriales bacterium]